MTNWTLSKTTSFSNAYETAKKALKVFGLCHQTHKCCEELHELDVAISFYQDHQCRGESGFMPQDEKDIVDEIADVWLTTLQMAEAFGIDRVFERLDFKVERLNGIIVKKLSEDLGIIVTILRKMTFTL